MGQDRTDTLNYFRSADSATIQRHSTPEERRDLTVRKELLWESACATHSEVNHQVEVAPIRELRSNEPAIGMQPPLAPARVIAKGLAQ